MNNQLQTKGSGEGSRPSRLNYYRRIFSAYLGSSNSQLSFWHETPEVESKARPGELREYYMTFERKADYAGALDDRGIPLLDYRGAIGAQYNPIAIAQYGLGNYNCFLRTGDPVRKERFLRCADWHAASLRQNQAGLRVWMHDFDWEYRDTLRAPWYSGLAQGQGISLLVRAHRETGRNEYLECARQAFESFQVDVKSGGVLYKGGNGDLCFEEYIVSPETHILNGFLWASWGVYDYSLATGDAKAGELFQGAVDALRSSLKGYDLGYWSLYEHSGTRLPMIASAFYHALHIVQLRVMHKITGERFFTEWADRWEGYQRRWLNRKRALAAKIAFKLLYY